ncbi:HNH endonuclease [Geodermatophilus sp. DSM 45219]|uniref:HNH endonuclease n=1 Tax=Geodermatophilus sp. DSM 45219 TaxID=1881103 RepID=UPI000887E046|nr:HNH endonuclease [Geodermatophilus sp. DSM 45219]
MDEKRCSTCEVSKPLDEFHRQSAAKDGRQRRCRGCVRTAGKAYKAANADRIAEYNRQWRMENPEAAKAATESWRERNRERYLESKLAWQRRNRDRRVEQARMYREANPEKYRAALAQWKAENPERVRDHHRKRRASRYGGVGQVDGETAWTDCGGLCGLCGDAIDRSLPWPDPESASLDHILPLSKGGAHDQSNVQWTHLVCNLRKGVTLP